MERHGLGPLEGSRSLDTRIRLSKGNAKILPFCFSASQRKALSSLLVAPDVEFVVDKVTLDPVSF